MAESCGCPYRGEEHVCMWPSELPKRAPVIQVRRTRTQMRERFEELEELGLELPDALKRRLLRDWTIPEHWAHEHEVREGEYIEFPSASAF